MRRAGDRQDFVYVTCRVLKTNPRSADGASRKSAFGFKKPRFFENYTLIDCPHRKNEPNDAGPFATEVDAQPFSGLARQRGLRYNNALACQKRPLRSA